MSTPSEPCVPEARTTGQFSAGQPWSRRLRSIARDAVVTALGLSKQVGGGGWVRFPYYHHVLDDERRSFDRQLTAMRAWGQFVTLDQALVLLAEGVPATDRYFCLTFDDGFRSCAYAAEVLTERSIPAAFYIATDFVGHALPPGPEARRLFGFGASDAALGFLSWNEIRRMAEAGMTIGSHSCSHPKLVGLDTEAARTEMERSKTVIEAEIGRPCRHFCAPYGLPAAHWNSSRDPELARQCGYASFATGLRGCGHSGTDPYRLPRDHLMAGWEVAQLRYFFSRP